ncbi:MAG TPA: hypothetical protein VFB33_00925 [Candidatus Binataceae bacterium]|jgi:hypothetical protein|nr:hypothetical protein [Candidatus Binataceae bacterium]
MRASGNRAAVAVALVAGAIGGALSARLWPAPRSAMAAGPQALAGITARRFEVMDEQGNARARLFVSPDGLAQLAMYDQQGIERAALAVSREGTTLLQMSGDDGKPRLAANVVMRGGPAAFTLFNPDGSDAAAITMSKDERALLLADGSGKARVRLDLEAGAAALTFYDKDGKPLKKLP